MGLRNKINKALSNQMEGTFHEAANKIADNLKILEEHLITVQKNQKEFEQYLKDIQGRLKKIENGK